MYQYFTVLMKAIYHGDDPADFIVLCERAESEHIFLRKIWMTLNEYVPVMNNHACGLMGVNLIYAAPSTSDKELLPVIERETKREQERIGAMDYAEQLGRTLPNIYSGTALYRSLTTVEELRRHINAPVIQTK